MSKLSKTKLYKSSTFELTESIGDYIGEDISFTNNEVTELFSDVNKFWIGVGKEKPYFQTKIESWITDDVLFFFCNINKVDDISKFKNLFGEKLNHNSIMLYYKNVTQKEWRISIINPNTNKMMVFELDYEKTLINTVGGDYVKLLTEYSLSSKKFNYIDDNYFSKNTNNGFTLCLEYMSWIIYEKNIIWYDSMDDYWRKN